MPSSIFDMSNPQDTGAPNERSHEFTVELNASADDVWRALSEAAELIKWFAPEARVEPGEGGKIYLSWGPGMEGASEISAWKPGEHLGTRMPAGSPEAPRVQAVDYYIENRDGRTVLRLVHSGFSADAKFDDEFESTHHGWLTFLAMLRHAVEQKAGVPAATCFQNIFVKVPRAAIWNRLTGPDGLNLESEKQEDGGSYRARLLDREISGLFARMIPGKSFSLIVDEMEGSVLSFFCEKWQQNGMLTVQAVLYGGMTSAKGTFDEVLTRFCDSLFPGEERMTF
ncbi:MAG: SRPBCC domain-containing protein [Bryobacterales bacterium]|nr:SRPBCC domain-containing protein [Bryobacterales bacterium]